MATPREVRRLGFQALYQLDARGGGSDDAAQVLSSLSDDDGDSVKFTAGECKKAFQLASDAFRNRAESDAFMTEHAPGWPAHRQAAVDRAILRLAHEEMLRGGTNPKIVVNEAVELAKEFSTDKSPAFINGLLDKLLKRIEAEKGASSDTTPAPSSTPSSEPHTHA